jgi:hypothetical protein
MSGVSDKENLPCQNGICQLKTGSYDVKIVQLQLKLIPASGQVYLTKYLLRMMPKIIAQTHGYLWRVRGTRIEIWILDDLW